MCGHDEQIVCGPIEVVKLRSDCVEANVSVQSLVKSLRVTENCKLSRLSACVALNGTISVGLT